MADTWRPSLLSSQFGDLSDQWIPVDHDPTLARSSWALGSQQRLCVVPPHERVHTYLRIHGIAHPLDPFLPSEDVAMLIAVVGFERENRSIPFRECMDPWHRGYLVDQYDDDWTRLAWVLCRGAAEVLEPGTHPADAPARDEILAELRAKYPQYHDHDLASRPILRLMIERVTRWGAVEG